MRWKNAAGVGLVAACLAFPTAATAHGNHYTFFVHAKTSGAWQHGQSFSTTENLYMNGKKVGTDEIACRFFPKSGKGFCHATFNLPDGSIFVSGQLPNANSFDIPIVNGTQDFTNAHGTLHVSGTHNGDNYRFSFDT